MSATPFVSHARPRRRRPIAMGLLVLVAAALLVGCTTKITAYGHKPRTNFVSGCTSPANGADKAKALPTSTCTCIYDKLSGKGGLSFSQFDKLEGQLREKKASLAKDADPVAALGSDGKKVTAFRDQCVAAAKAKASTASTTSTSSSSTTVPNSASGSSTSTSTTVGTSTTAGATTTTKAP